MKTITVFLVATILFISLGCSKNDTTPNPNVIFKASLTGNSETPATGSAATGSATLTYDTTTKIFTAVITYSGVTATAGHIHKGDVGVAGGVIFPFSSLTSPITYTSQPLDAGQQTDLMSNLYYVNLHSTAFPKGEIRGQLIKQ